MEFYGFVRGLLGWIASIAILVPIYLPMLYLAHRIREAQVPEDDRMESDELWKRATYGAIVVAVMTAVFLFADLVAADWASLPPGLVHFVILLAYIPAAAYVLAMFFGYDDYFHGVALLTLSLGLPLFVLFAVNAIVGVWDPVVGWFLSFLKPIVS